MGSWTSDGCRSLRDSRRTARVGVILPASPARTPTRDENEQRVSSTWMPIQSAPTVPTESHNLGAAHSGRRTKRVTTAHLVVPRRPRTTASSLPRFASPRLRAGVAASIVDRGRRDGHHLARVVAAEELSRRGLGRSVEERPTHISSIRPQDEPGKGLDRETDLPAFRANIARYVDEARLRSETVLTPLLGAAPT